ncbi:MAG: hypothetical protein HN945_16245 [Deltaproteobacteria bacterium]|jgi:hypothetical protein|nr:hypothetical protein [Bacteroidota bacterium]MBT6612869.1 hypothetical protein [Deltaproteobacteria bacterium]MBT7153988.1 hypothetical protein [Deltaproteobacteria bacterium]
MLNIDDIKINEKKRENKIVLKGDMEYSIPPSIREKAIEEIFRDFKRDIYGDFLGPIKTAIDIIKVANREAVDQRKIDIISELQKLLRYIEE